MVEYFPGAADFFNWEFISDAFGFDNEELKIMRDFGHFMFDHDGEVFRLTYKEFTEFAKAHITDFSGKHYYPVKYITVLSRKK